MQHILQHSLDESIRFDYGSVIDHLNGCNAADRKNCIEMRNVFVRLTVFDSPLVELCNEELYAKEIRIHNHL